MSARGPSRTMDQNRYGFLPRWFRTEIFNHCRLFFQVSVHLPCHINSPPKDAEILVRPVFNRRHSSSHHDQQRTTLQQRRILMLSRESLTSSTRRPHRTSINQMDSSRSWSRKSKPHTRKRTDLRMLKWEPYYSYVTPQSWKTYHAPAEILHGRPAQGAVMPRRHRPINIQKICRWLLEIQQTQKEHFDWAHRAKDERILKVREQVRFFPQKQYGTKLKWLTGTVIEILERGRSYIIEGPNGKKYRRNWAHLKPLCHDGSSFQDPPKAKRQILTRHDNVDSFQDPRPRTRERALHSKSDPIIFKWIPIRAYRRETWHPTLNPKSTSSSHHVHSPRSPSSSPPAQFSPREHLVSPNSREPHCT